MLIKAITVFIAQLVFIGFRTWNVRAVASGNITTTIISGAVIHLSWLASISIGVITATDLVEEFSWGNVFIVICSLTGGIIGSIIGLKFK